MPSPSPSAPVLSRRAALSLALGAAGLGLCACTGSAAETGSGSTGSIATGSASTAAASITEGVEAILDSSSSADGEEDGTGDAEADADANPTALRAALDLTEDYRADFVHGEKGAAYQKYLVLHDTEGTGDAQSVVDWWEGNGNLIAAHFVVNKDGSMVQCVELDCIAHHAGFGDTGHNELYGVEDESRDDRLGTTPIGSAYADYGMNSYSIGIEMVHVGGEGDYPAAQLEAVDALIAYLDAYYGFESQIIDHKAWRTTNSDTSEEFAGYLANYQDHRTHGSIDA